MTTGILVTLWSPFVLPNRQGLLFILLLSDLYDVKVQPEFHIDVCIRRAVSKYLQTLFIKESERGRTSLSMDSLLVGKTRKEASRMFFEALVCVTPVIIFFFDILVATFSPCLVQIEFK